MSTALTARQQFLPDLWDQRVLHEFGTLSVEQTLDTMVPDARMGAGPLAGRRRRPAG